ncbi:MAG: DUF308 domain-containing protein [Clostridia bacterium]|nr:DUF308 domain-containing protein [Clostridia bacterium]
MAKKISLNLSTNFLTAIIYATIGLLFCIFRQEVVSWAMLITGTLLVIRGILDAMSNRKTAAVIAIIIGVLLIVLRFTLPDFIIKVFGIILAVSGISQLFNGSKKKLIPLISCLITIVAGLLLVVFSGETLSLIFLISGILLIIDAVVALLARPSL